jgi:Na+-transporting methylmalonyl-CoA/oxaloacetate decarboxylase gamma subunit
MGTVFLCLMLLYLMTRMLGKYVPRLLASALARAAATAGADVSGGESEAQPGSAADEEAAPESEGIAAAIAIVLTRHRSSRTRAEVDVTRATSPWKMAGRMRALRDR